MSQKQKTQLLTLFPALRIYETKYVDVIGKYILKVTFKKQLNEIPRKALLYFKNRSI